MLMVATRPVFLAALLLGIASAIVFATPISAAERIDSLVATPEYNHAELAWEVALSWTDPDGATDGTDILRRITGHATEGEFAPIATVAAGETSYTDSSDIQARTTYVYRVQRLSDSRKSNGASARLPKVPDVPIAVGASAGQSSITVSWDSPDRGNVSSFEVYHRSAAQTGYGLVGTVEATGTSFIDDNIQVGMPYDYRVVAVNIYGSSGGTVPVSVAVSPSAPTNFQMTADESVTYEQVRLSPYRHALSHLSWDSVQDGLTFRLYLIYIPNQYVQPATHFFADFSVSPAQIDISDDPYHKYYLTAVAKYEALEDGALVEREVESSPSEVLQYTPVVLPPVVTSFSIPSPSPRGTQLEFQWFLHRLYHGFDSFRIYRRPVDSQSPYELVSETDDLDPLTHIDDPSGKFSTNTGRLMIRHTVLLDPEDVGVAYEYTVVGVNLAGREGPHSTPIPVTVGLAFSPPPAPVREFRVTVTTSESELVSRFYAPIEFSWREGPSDALTPAPTRYYLNLIPIPEDSATTTMDVVTSLRERLRRSNSNAPSFDVGENGVVAKINNIRPSRPEGGVLTGFCGAWRPGDINICKEDGRWRVLYDMARGATHDDHIAVVTPSYNGSFPTAEELEQSATFFVIPKRRGAN